MAKRQTRRTVSLSRELYTALQEHCQQTNQTIAGFVEQTVRAGLNMAPNQPIYSKPRQPVKLSDLPEAYHSEGRRRVSRDPRLVRALEFHQRKLDAERLAQRALETNPCRKEGCPIIGLHEAHT